MSDDEPSSGPTTKGLPTAVATSAPVAVPAPSRGRPKPGAADLCGAPGRQASAAPGRPRPRRAQGCGGSVGAQGVSGQAAVDSLLRATCGVAPGDDRPAEGHPRRPGGQAVAPAAHPDPDPDGRQRQDDQVGVAAARWRPGRERAHALPQTGHDLRLQPGRLRHELPVLRHRPRGADPQHVNGRDRRTGRARRTAAQAGHPGCW